MSALEYWESEIFNLAPSTRKNYRHALKMFLEWMDTDEEGLYQQHKEAIEDSDSRKSRLVPLKVRNYMAEQVEKGYAAGTAQITANAVKSFFQANELQIAIRPRDMPRGGSVGSRVILPDQLRYYYDNVNAPFRNRNRALISFLKDSGLRVSDASNMNVEDFRQSETRKTDSGEFRILKPFKTRKTGEIAYVHLGPEAVTDVSRYLADRMSGPLFLGRGGKRLTSEAITMIFTRLGKKLKESGRVSAHSLRKFHRTRLESKMPESWVKKLQGKATDPYTHPEQTGELSKAYIAAYDQLRVLDQVGVDQEARKEIDMLRSQVTTLQRLIELEIKRNQIMADVENTFDKGRLREGFDKHKKAESIRSEQEKVMKEEMKNR